MKIISPKSDFCLKELLSNTVVLRHFISDILGIPDILAEMDDDTKIGIELQVKMSRFWDKRQLFYLSKLYASELQFGEDYDRLKRCVCISILDFPLVDSVEYHRVYRLRDRRAQDAYEREEVESKL